jgi:hypothetical protein
VQSKNPAGRICAQLLIVLSGAWLLLVAARATDPWIVQHVVLPNYFLFAPSLRQLHLARAAIALLGLLLALLAPAVGRWVGSQSWRELAGSFGRIALALLLAVSAAELVVRRWDSGEPFWRKGKLEFRIGRPDPRFGWVALPSRSTVLQGGGAKLIHYHIDAWSNRVAGEFSTIDPALPTLVVTGESIAFGHGLEYEDTFAAILGERMGLQVVNVSCGGYGSDQAYLRLMDVLYRLEHPVAVVTVFLPVQLGRGLQDYRPRLVLRDGQLFLEPATSGLWSRWRLRDLWVNELPYLSDAALSQTMALHAAIFQATSRVARARGAEPLFVVPSFGPPRSLAEHPEAFIVRELFEKQSQPYLLIDIGPERIMPLDWHPDAVATREIAARVEGALQPRLAR